MMMDKFDEKYQLEHNILFKITERMEKMDTGYRAFTGFVPKTMFIIDKKVVTPMDLEILQDFGLMRYNIRPVNRDLVKLSFHLDLEKAIQDNNLFEMNFIEKETGILGFWIAGIPFQVKLNYEEIEVERDQEKARTIYTYKVEVDYIKPHPTIEHHKRLINGLIGNIHERSSRLHHRKRHRLKTGDRYI